MCQSRIGTRRRQRRVLTDPFMARSPRPAASAPQPSTPPIPEPEVAEFLRFLDVERNSAPRTLTNYRHALAEFRIAEKTAWRDLTPDHFRRYLFAITKRGLA